MYMWWFEILFSLIFCLLVHSRRDDRDDQNPQLDALRDIEQHFQNLSDNGRDDPR